MYWPLPPASRHVERSFPGLQCLISAALANPLLADTLLNDPVTALANLPSGVMLTREELDLVLQVRGVTSITNFAAYLYALMQDAQIEGI